MSVDDDKLSEDQIQAEDRAVRGGPAAPDDAVDTASRPAPDDKASPEEAAKEDVKPELKVGSRFNDKRARIAEKFRQQRAQDESTEAIEPISDERERMRFGEHVETRADRVQKATEEPPQEATQEPAQAQEPQNGQVAASDGETPPETRSRRLKVNGRDVEVTEEQIVAYAQQAIAAGDIVGQAKNARQQQIEILEALQKAQADQPAADSASEGDHPQDRQNRPNEEELGAIVDRIQVGTPDEAKAALVDFLELVNARNDARLGDLDQQIGETIRLQDENRQREAQMRETLQGFTKDNPIYEQDPTAQAALAYEAAAVMRQNMRDIGVTDDAIRQTQERNRSSEMEAVGSLYRGLRSRGYQLPDNRAVLDVSADNLVKRFGGTPEPQQQTPSPDNSAREERKRDLGPQPRRATASPSTETQERSREQARVDAVRAMRAARRPRRAAS